MYADKITKSMKYAIEETNNRRKVQGEFNEKFGITPKSVTASIKDITEKLKEKSDKNQEQQYHEMNKVEFQKLIKNSIFSFCSFFKDPFKVSLSFLLHQDSEVNSYRLFLPNHKAKALCLSGL